MGVFIDNVTFCSNKFHWFALRVGCTVDLCILDLSIHVSVFMISIKIMRARKKKAKKKEKKTTKNKTKHSGKMIYSRVLYIKEKTL